MIGKLEIQLIGKKRWNQKASQRYLEAPRRALQAQLSIILIEEKA